MKKIILLFILVSNCALAQLLKIDKNGDYILSSSEFSFANLVSHYAKLSGKNLIIDNNIKGKSFLFGVKRIKKEEIDLYISAVANQSGYTLLENESLNQIEVINARDIRYKSTVLYSDITKVPKTYSYVQFIMKLEHIEASEISRNFRPFMSRYGRIIDEKNANTLIISDTGKNIHRLYMLTKKLDSKSFIKRKQFIKKINKNAQKEIIKKESLIDFIKNQHILFLIVFTFIGGFIGFGVRGYLMKKIEGGW